MKKYISGQRRSKEMQMRKSLFENYIPEAAYSLSLLSDVPREKIIKGLEKMLKKGNATQEENGDNDEEE